MTQHFLDKLAEEILSKRSLELSKLCVVFPSVRAGLFFKKFLSSKLEKPAWAPEILGIKDFVNRLSPLAIEDKIILIFELYEVYKQHIKGESFDSFYPWGNMILDDFDDIDKNLVPPDEIFRIIKETRELEETFEMTFGDFDEFRKFWRSFSSQDLSENQRDFLKTWEILGLVYKEFRQRLSEKNIAYEGMAYRKIYVNIRTNKTDIKWDKIIFAGFNALNKAEEGIIRELTRLGKAETYWDADKYYAGDPKQEAGSFLRNAFRNLEIKKPNWIVSTLSEDAKKITVIGAPLQSGQVKALGAELRKLNQISSEITDSTAVVLPDERLLIPLLHSIPEEIGSFNVTMGYPIKDTPIYSFVEALKKLQKNKKGKKTSTVFYHKDVTEVLMHPYIKSAAPKISNELVDRIRERNIIYVPADMLNSENDILHSTVFTYVDSVKGTIDYLEKVLSYCSSKLESSQELDKEYFFIFFTQLNRLSDIISKYPQEIKTETFWKILSEVLTNVRIPFSGEPLKGLQIMGVLETRSIDFDNVFILSMNEGIMPKGNTHSSFIPFHLRKAFRLPTFEDEDAISAYYFYRLIQKAKNIFLFYNTEPGDFAAGEKSRFILQLESELAKNNKNISFEELILDIPAPATKKIEIKIIKDNEIIEKLRSIGKFSATSLTSFISCSLKFYLERIARLKEEEDIEEFFGGATFGKIFHEVMKVLYNNYAGKIISKDDFAALNKLLDNEFDPILEEAFKEADKARELAGELQGKNLLYKGIMQKLAKKILENDEIDAPFKVIDLEEQYLRDIEITVNGRKEKLILNGRIDRVDERKNKTRIIDYKTGRVTSRKINENNFGLMFADPEYKEYFQTHFYALLYNAAHPEKVIMPGIYPLRNIGEGIRYVSEGELTTETINKFEAGLKVLLSSLFDAEKPFIQTENEEHCRFCAFRSICYRD
jgi:hypothetical protein